MQPDDADDDADADEPDGLFELTQSLAHIGVWTLDLATEELSCSEELARILGRPVDELQASFNTTVALVLPEHQDEMVAYHLAVVGGEDVEPLQLRIARPDGEVRWVEASARLMGPDRLMGVVQDITPRMEIQQELQALQARAEVAQEMGHFATIEMDFNAGTVAWSPEMFRITGQDPETFSPDDDAFSVLHPDDIPTAIANAEDIASGRGGEPVEFRVVRPDGTVRWIRSHGRVVGVKRLVGFVQDVTERHEHDEDRRLHTRILELMRESVSVVAPDPPRYLYVNPRFAESLGLSPEEAFATSPESLVDDPEVAAAIGRAVNRDGSWEGDLTLTRADGSLIVSHLSITQVDLPDRGRVSLVVSSDVTELHRREEELHQREEQLRLIEDHSPIGLGLVSLDGRWIEANAALCEIVGRTEDELYAVSLAEVTHPDDLESDRALIAGLLAGDHESYQREKRYLRPDGTFVWVLVSVFLLRDTDGHPQCFVGQAIDTTDRKHAELELRRSAEQLREANEAKTRFLSRMSHELRTPLNAVLGYGQLLALSNLTGEDHASVDQILSAGRHLLSLIDEVLDITSVEAGSLRLELEPVDAAGVIDHAVQLVQPMAAVHGVTIMVTAPGPGDPPAAIADRQRMSQILLNLLSNGIKYNRSGGTVAVVAERHGDRLRISVTDTGLGIPADAIGRVFDPFDRLGAEQLGIEGTGIGLSLARNLAERMGGTIVVRSEPDEGSTFTLELPAHPAEPDGSDRRDPASGAADADDAARDADDDRPLRVVLIEPSATRQELIDAALRRRKRIELHRAPTGAGGLELVSQLAPELVLLGLDVADMSPGDVLRRVRSAGDVPAPVVVALGEENDLDRVNAIIASGVDAYLSEPLDLAALFTLVDGLARDRARDRRL